MLSEYCRGHRASDGSTGIILDDFSYQTILSIGSMCFRAIKSDMAKLSMTVS